MTLLQTRVDDDVADGFKRAAAALRMTPYAYLQTLVKSAAGRREGRGWAEHKAWLESVADPALRNAENACLATRNGEDR